MLFTLITFLILASWFDFKNFRIPNFLTFFAASAGLLLNTFIGDGLLFSLAGVVVGLLLFLVPYALGRMGAGDVKMLAAAGAFLGPVSVIWAALWSLIAGGILAVLWVWYLKINPESAYVPSGATRDYGQEIAENSASRTAMPYALAIAVGTLIAIIQVVD